MKIKAIVDFSLGGSKTLKAKETAEVNEKDGLFFIGAGLAEKIKETTTKKTTTKKAQ